MNAAPWKPAPLPPLLTTKLELVTPLFMGGAEPHVLAEWRLPSVKGLLRRWYRALDGEAATSLFPDGPSREEVFFGSTNAGQSACLLRVDAWKTADHEFQRATYLQGIRDGGFQQGYGARGTNGLMYLGYPLKGLGGSNRRSFNRDDGPLSLYFLPVPDLDHEELVRRSWIAALWLLVHIGGAGTRSRRGFGSFRIMRWGGWAEHAELPLPCKAPNVQAWKEGMEKGFSVLRTWFPVAPQVQFTSLAPGARFRLCTAAFNTWEEAQADAGERLQQFRSRYAPDYALARGYLTRAPGATVSPGTNGPDRAGFGLPLMFRFTGIPGRSVVFVGTEHGRMASPLFLRIVRLGDGYHSVFTGLPSPLLPPGEGLCAERDPASQWTWSPGARTIVHQFLSSPFVADAVEVTL